MSITNDYPVFEADQVLTNENLNDLFNYLDEQDRLTRCKLLGSGIVCGLEITYTNNTINISKGCGLTSQGFIILFCDHIGTNGYTHCIPYLKTPFPNDLQLIIQCGSEPDMNHIPFYSSSDGTTVANTRSGLFLLLTEEEYNALDANTKTAAVSISQSGKLSDYAVVLFLEAKESSLKNCDTNDCNNKGSRIDFNILPLLVNKKLLSSFGNSSGNNGNLQFTHVELRRYNVPFKNLNSSHDVLNSFVNLLDDNTIQNLSNDMKYCFQQYGYLLSNPSLNPFDSFFNDFKISLKLAILQRPILIQYFYDFIDDLIKAFYEFRYKVINVASECCGNEMKFPFHLVLGEATVNTNSDNRAAYRQYFIYSPLFDRQNEELNEIRSLLKRMELMIETFLLKGMTASEFRIFIDRTIKITPSHYGNAFLSERCIPYYYDVINEKDPNNLDNLFYYWNYEKTKRGNEQFNLSYHASSYSNDDTVINPLYYDIEPFNFFRIEGHIGKPINSALSIVKSMQKQLNLPFDVIALSADYIGALLKGEDPECCIQDLESDYRILISDFICKLHDAFCYISRIPYKPAVILAESVSGVTKKAATTKKTAKAAAATSTGIIDNILTISSPAILSIARPFISELVNEFQAAPTYVKGTTLSHLCVPPADTIGGYYINMLSKGAFKNPISPNAGDNVSVLYRHFFEFIDSIESMLLILMTESLDSLDTAIFKTTYTRYQTEINAINRLVSTIAKELGDKAINTIYEVLTELFINNLQILLHTCITEKLEALKREYLRRQAQLRLAKNFNYYFKMHGGIEHKAGVPRGGTFILVYHEERRNRFVDSNSIFINKELSNIMLSRFSSLLKPEAKPDTLESEAKLFTVATLYKDPALYLQFKDVMQKYLDECKDLPNDTRNQISVIINRPPPGTTGFNLTDGAVIADFYVPYLCCSDCPPITYIISQPVTITIDKKEFCKDDKGKYPVTLDPAGGVLKIDGKKVSNSTNFSIQPAELSLGQHTLTYTVNNKSTSATIRIVNQFKASFLKGHPQKSYRFVEDIDFSIKSSARPDAIYNWDFGDNTTQPNGGLRQKHHYDDPIKKAGQYSFTVTVIIIDGPCQQKIEANFTIDTTPIQ